MSTISILYLEHHIDQHLLLLAEKLLERYPNTQINEAEKGLWVGQIQDNEVELQIKSKKLVAFSCDGPDCSNEEMSKPVVAALILLRRRLVDDQFQEAQRQAVRYKPKALTTALVLKNVERDSLVEFFRFYSKMDKNLGLYLKAYFASDVSITDEEVKFSSILDSIVPRRARSELSIPQGLKVKKVVKLLIDRANDSLEEKKFLDAINASKAILEYLSPFLHQEKIQKHRLDELCHEALYILESGYKRSVAPSLKESIESYLKEEIQKNFYMGYPILFHFLWRFYYLIFESGLEDREKLLTIINRKDVNEEVKKQALYFLFKADKKDKELSVIEGLDMELHLINSFAERMMQQGELKILQRFLNAVEKEKENNLEELKVIYQLQFERAKSAEDKRALQHYIPLVYFSYLDIYYFKAIDLLSEKKAIKLKEKIYASLEKKLEDVSAQKALATLYLEYGAYDDLKALIDRVQSVDFLSFVSVLSKGANKEELNALYPSFKAVLKSYLDVHIGLPPVAKVGDLMSKLVNSNNSKLASKLFAFVEKEYPKRKHLLEELNFIV